MTRTGPLGRAARVVLAGVYALTLSSIVDQRGSAHFRNPHILSEPSAWLLHVVMFATFVLLAGALGAVLWGRGARTRVQAGAVVVAAAAIVIAAEVTHAVGGAYWGFPLADLVWWFDVTMLVLGLAASLLSAALGTPGCEIGVWPELIARGRGRALGTETGLACIVGLHLLDGWEARHRARAVRE